MSEPALKSVPPMKGPRVGLVASTPPPSRRGGGFGVVAQIEGLIAEMERGTWYQVATFTAKSSANSERTMLVKRGHTDVEWAARSIDGGSGLWACKK